MRMLNEKCWMLMDTSEIFQLAVFHKTRKSRVNGHLWC